MIKWPKKAAPAERRVSLTVGQYDNGPNVGVLAADDKGRQILGILYTPDQAVALADDLYRSAALARQSVVS